MQFQLSKGSRVSIAKMTANTAYTKLDGVKTFTPPRKEVQKVEVTHLESEADEFIPGTYSWTDMNLELGVKQDSPTDEILKDIEETRETVKIKIEVPKPGIAPITYKVEEYEGFCTGYAFNIAAKEQLTAEVTFSVNRRVPAV